MFLTGAKRARPEKNRRRHKVAVRTLRAPALIRFVAVAALLGAGITQAGPAAGLESIDSGATLSPGVPAVVLVSNPPIVDHTLSIDPGGWGPVPVDFSYQWNRIETITGPGTPVPVPGATNPTYTLTSADTGRRISVTVTGAKNGYAAQSVTSLPTGMVHGPQPLWATPEPTIAGLDPWSRAALAGSEITVVPGNWEPAQVALTYQWLRSTSLDLRSGYAPIEGATQPSYTPTVEDIGHMLNVQVTGAKPTYRTWTRANTSQQPVFIEPARDQELPASPTVRLSGPAQEWGHGSADTDGWGAVPVTLHYQWKRNGNPIPGMTGGSYGFSSGDVGSRITVTVTGVAPGYAPKSVTSAPTPLVISATSKTFSDISAGSQFAKEIGWLSDTGVSTGYPDGTFKPLQAVTRDAMAAFMYRLGGKPAFAAPDQSPFGDVFATTQFYNEMTWLSAQKISAGWPDRTYRPFNSVTRDAMAAFMYRLAGAPDYIPPAQSPFTDVSPDSQFYKEISWLAASKISTGYEDGSFRPLQPVNRDAMAAFMFRHSNPTAG